MSKAKTEERSIALTSNALIHTPGYMLWAKHVWSGKHAKDKRCVLKSIMDGYGLPRGVTIGLLDGSIEYTVKGEVVNFTAQFPVGWKRAA